MSDVNAPERIWVLLKSGEAHFKKPTHFNADAPEYVHIGKVRALEAEVARTKLHMSAWEDSARINLARAEAAEARLSQPASGSGVKALEWKEDQDDDGTEIHRTRGGEVNLPYTIYEDGFTSKPFGLTLNQLRIGSFDTVPEAKAAAQADYERRIRSALIEPPSPQAVPSAFPPDDYRLVAGLLRQHLNDEPKFRAVMSNNFNIILAALDKSTLAQPAISDTALREVFTRLELTMATIRTVCRNVGFQADGIKTIDDLADYAATAIRAALNPTREKTLSASPAGSVSVTDAMVDAALLPAPQDASPAQADDWRDDPSADERWNAGLQYGLDQLCTVLGVDPQTVNWDAATETLDGDVQSVIGNILTKRFGDDWQAALSLHSEGWRLLPVEPTDAMLSAWRMASMNIQGGYDGPSPYEAMLAAAPTAPGKEG